MARLQDFQTVTPTSADKLLVVQSQGQGLVPYGSKLDSANPTGTGSLSLNRASGSTVGTNSVAVGISTTASGSGSFAEGNSTVASGIRAHAEGEVTTASGYTAHAEGTGTTASGNYSHAEGENTIAKNRAQHVFGQNNLADTSTAGENVRGNFIEIVGNGTSTSNRSNARTLDWSGNEVLAGGLKINGNQDVATEVGWAFSMANNMVDFGSRTKIIKSSHFIIATLSLRFPDPFTFTNSDTKVLNFTTSIGIGDALKNALAITGRGTPITIVLKNDGIYLGGLLGAGCAVSDILPLSVAFAF